MSAVHQARIEDHLRARQQLLAGLAAPGFAGLIDEVAHRVAETFRRGGTVYLCGNGGSAADCDHIAAEFVGRFRTDRAPLPALALTTSLAAVTSIANDFSFDEVFSRQIRGLTRARDTVIGLSTSGRSVNVIRALEAARDLGACAVAVTGRHGGKLADAAELAVRIPSAEVAHIQEVTLMIGHVMCDIVESMLGLDACGGDDAGSPDQRLSPKHVAGPDRAGLVDFGGAVTQRP